MSNLKLFQSFYKNFRLFLIKIGRKFPVFFEKTFLKVTRKNWKFSRFESFELLTFFSVTKKTLFVFDEFLKKKSWKQSNRKNWIWKIMIFENKLTIFTKFWEFFRNFLNLSFLLMFGVFKFCTLSFYISIAFILYCKIKVTTNICSKTLLVSRPPRH